MAAPHTAHDLPASRETLYAILGSLLGALILATILTGNPFRALVAAYTDYAHSETRS